MGDTDGDAKIEIRLLGPIEALRNGDPVALPGGRALRLLALLALRVGHSVTTDRLIDELWGLDAPSSARTLIQGFVSKLRKALGAESIETTRTGYRLALADEAIDAHRFQAMVAAAAEERVSIDRASMLADALTLWRGAALADLAYEPFAQRAIAALEDSRLTAREDLAHARIELEDHRRVVDELDQLTASHPFRERLWELLALALYGSGRQAEALEACRRARTTLVDELGIEPGPGLRALEERILHQDPSLMTAGTSRPESPRGERSWMPRERRTVTAVFVQVSTTDPAADPEITEAEIAAVAHDVEEAVTSSGGTVERSPGGRLVGWFGLLAGHEDDPLHALRAALQARERSARQATTVRLRVGVETGEAIADRTSVTGSAVTTAARLLEQAEDGEILIGPAIARLVKGSAVVAPHDGGPVEARRLLAVRPDATLLPRTLHASMVGRQAELTLLRTTFARVVRSGRPSRITVVGEAGVGKSRLARAFLDSIGDAATIGQVRCPSTGPMDAIAILGELLEPVVPSREDLAQVSPQNLFATVRDLVTQASREQPTVLIVDDCQWAQTTVLDLLEHLANSVDGPAMLLCLTRPELFDTRPGWDADEASAALLTLEPLDAEAIARVVEDRSELEPSPEQRARITELAHGNPLFAEQLVATLEHDEPDRVPASLNGLLASRIDRLGPGEKDLLRCASVAGSELTAAVMNALLPKDAQAFVSRHLDALQRRGLMHRSGDTIRFSHDLIRDAAYRSVTRSDRAHLHQRLADWLTSQEDRSTNHDAVIGHHLEQAVLNRRLLGADDQRVDALASRAGEYLAAAGAAALGRMDLPAAEDLLRRSLDMLPDEHAARARAMQQLAEVSLPMGLHEQAQGLLEALADRPQLEEGARWLARLERSRSLTLTDAKRGELDEAAAVARMARAFFEEAGDSAGMARALFLEGWLELLRGLPTEAEQTARLGMEHADRAGALREENAARWLVLQALLAGPTPVETCLDESASLTVLRGAEHPLALLHKARLLAMATRFAEARDLAQVARSLIIERLRTQRLLMFADWAEADIHALAQQPPFAMRAYRAALARARADGERGHTAELAARLGLQLADQGRHDEARELADECRDAAPAGHVAVQVLSRLIQARTTEETAGSLGLAREALDLVPTQMLPLQAEVAFHLSVIESSFGLHAEADKHREQAIALHEHKGNLASADFIRSRPMGFATRRDRPDSDVR